MGMKTPCLRAHSGSLNKTLVASTHNLGVSGDWAPWGGGWGVLLGILGGGVPPGSSNPDPISDLNMPFSTPVFRSDL